MKTVLDNLGSATSTLVCDVCGVRATFHGHSAANARVQARAAGWRILGTTAFCSPKHQAIASQPARAPNRKTRRKARA